MCYTEKRLEYAGMFVKAGRWGTEWQISGISGRKDKKGRRDRLITSIRSGVTDCPMCIGFCWWLPL